MAHTVRFTVSVFLNPLSVSSQLSVTWHYTYGAHSLQRRTTREFHGSRYFVRIRGTQHLRRHNTLNLFFFFSKIFTDVLRSFAAFQQTHTLEYLLFHDRRRGHVSLRKFPLKLKDTRILAQLFFSSFSPTTFHICLFLNPPAEDSST